MNGGPSGSPGRPDHRRVDYSVRLLEAANDLTEVGLGPNWEKPSAGLVVSKIKGFLERHRIELFEFSGCFQDYPAGCSLAGVLAGWKGRIDLLLVVGGDGTILRVARDLSSWQVPLLGINLGQRGFLAAIEIDSLERYLQNIVGGQYSYEQRMMLEAVVKRGEKILARYQALNDLVVSRGPSRLFASIPCR